MELPLDGCVALVTGASSGIGEAAAKALAAQGASVVLAARRKNRLDAVAKEISSTGKRAIVIETDVTQQVQAASAVEHTIASMGRLDIVINNAGISYPGPIFDAPLAEWEHMVNLNVLGMLYIAHATLPHLLKASEDSPRHVSDLINISSVAGRVTRQNSGVYSLTKFGVNAFSESLRQEVTSRHVRVALIEPGVTDTEILTHMRPESRDLLLNRIGTMERLQAVDIADAIIYVATRPRHVAINEILIRSTEQVS